VAGQAATRRHHHRAATTARPFPALLQHPPAAPVPAAPHPGTGLRRPPQGQTHRTRIGPHWRLRHDTVDTGGTVTLRYHSRLHHIGLGRGWAGTHVRVLVHDRHIRVITRDGQLLRDLTLDPTRDYQPHDTSPAVPKRPRKENDVARQV
jgi:hypothetical protein